MKLIKFSHRNRRLNLRIQYKLVILQTRHQCRLMFEARVDGKVLIGRSTCRIPLRDSHLEEVAVFFGASRFDWNYANGPGKMETLA